MSKTLTTFEALKANETKRVRIAKIGEWHEVGELIDLLNRGDLDYKRHTQWEAEESLIERWAVLNQDSLILSIHYSESDALDYRDNCQPEARIVHLREVRS